MVTIRGEDFKQPTVRDSYNRRAQQYKNRILTCLRQIGINPDDVDVPLESNAMRNAQALASWYIGNDFLLFSYNRAGKFAENLAMVAQVIEHFAHAFETGQITQEELVSLFREEHDVLEQRKEARKVLGVPEDSTDFEAMNKSYKALAKEHHPDKETGDTETFKKINTAHKILRRELG